MSECRFCGEIFESPFEMFKHQEECLGSVKYLLISLNGNFEDRANQIAKACMQMQNLSKSFQIIPLNFSGGVLEKVLIIG